LERTLAKSSHSIVLEEKNRLIKNLRAQVSRLQVGKWRAEIARRAAEAEIKKYKKDLVKQVEQLVADVALGKPSGFGQLLKRTFAMKTKRQYSREERELAICIHYYISKRGYTYLRSLFSLPCGRTIRRWLRDYDALPGLIQKAMDALVLRAKASRAKGKSLVVNLQFDEAAVRRELTLLQDGTTFGFIDLGRHATSNDDVQHKASSNLRPDPCAKEVLVFMVVGINDNFKIPVAYYMIGKSISSSCKASMTREVIMELQKAEIEVAAVVCDGKGLSVLKDLGVDVPAVLAGSSTARDCSFPHPSFPDQDCKRIFGILDACHLLKLLRNAIGELKVLKWGNHGNVEWKYFENLHSLQKHHELSLAPKFRRRHVEFQRHIMDVSLAAQTLSRSVSLAMDCCRLQDFKLDDKDFSDSKVTADWTMLINDLFDVLNTKNLKGKGFVFYFFPPY
jgi:hypothetical protein